jgi:hypothetical protein
MDLNLVTGHPGASKTLNVLKEVEERRIREARPVFYANIEELKLPWTKMADVEELANDPTLITPHSWFNAPPGAIIVIDEAQDFYPAMSATAKQPEYIMRMAKFRHLGYSMYLITQGPSLINVKIKEWVTPHIHYARVFGGWYSKKFVSERCVDNPRAKGAFDQAMRSLVRIDKRYFGLYKSAAMHFSHTRTPLKMWLLVLVPLVLVPTLFVSAFKMFTAQGEAPPEDSAVAQPVAAVAANSGTIGATVMPEGDRQRFDPVTAYVPRVEAMPETAPAYDELRKPKDFPRPQCLRRKKRCECYTQQGTLMRDYPRDLCIANVERGYFDPTRPRAASVVDTGLKVADPQK